MSARARAAAAVLVTTALVAVACPSLAAAAGEPQITSAGIDAQDRLYATWTLAPGTTFEGISFSASSILHPLFDYEYFADIESFAGLECTPPPKDCGGTPAQTSYRESVAVSRDRRYFVIVKAKAGDATRTSAMWVIDEAKPLIPGAGEPADPPTNSPVLGRPLVEPPRETIPDPTLSLPAPRPVTIAGYLRRGIRVRVTCPRFECYAFAVLDHGGDSLAIAAATARPGGRRTLVLRPTRAQRAKLRRRTQVRLDLSVLISQPARKETRITRSIRLRR